MVDEATSKHTDEPPTTREHTDEPPTTREPWPYSAVRVLEDGRKGGCVQVLYLSGMSAGRVLNVRLHRQALSGEVLWVSIGVILRESETPSKANALYGV